MLDSTDF